jgi:hypothetical protein
MNETLRISESEHGLNVPVFLKTGPNSSAISDHPDPPRVEWVIIMPKSVAEYLLASAEF